MNTTTDFNDDHSIEINDGNAIGPLEAAHHDYHLEIEQLKAENERLKAENERLQEENAELIFHLSEGSAVAASQDFSGSSQGLMVEEHAIEEAMLSPTVTSPALTATTSLPPSPTSAVNPCPASTTPCEHWQLLSAYGDLYCIGREKLELT